MAHSPTPWALHPNFKQVPVDADGKAVSIISNSHIIIKAVNSYDKNREDLDNATAVIHELAKEKAEHRALIKQLVEALNVSRDHGSMTGDEWVFEKVDAALAAAKEAGF